MSTDVSVVEQESFEAAFAEVRSDSSPVNWVLVGHYEGNPNEVCLLQSGEGGVEELAEHIDDEQCLYGLVRLDQEFEMTVAVKFVYIRWSGPDLAFTKRGRYGVVKGSIEKLFDPYHILFECDHTDELTTDCIMTKLQETSGTKNKVLEAAEAKTRQERGFTSGTTTKADSTGATPTQASHVTQIGRLGSSFSGVSTTGKKGSVVDITQDVYDSVKAVRLDNNNVNWCVVGYEGGSLRKPLVVLATGEGDIDELKANLADDAVAYGLYRATDIVDEIPTVKFVFIQWLGENISPMTRGKVSTHKGALEELFNPSHVTIFATTATEVTQRVVMDKVMSASGSKSHIKT